MKKKVSYFSNNSFITLISHISHTEWDKRKNFKWNNNISTLLTISFPFTACQIQLRPLVLLMKLHLITGQVLIIFLLTSLFFSFELANVVMKVGVGCFARHFSPPRYEVELNFNFPFHVTHNIWLFHHESEEVDLIYEHMRSCMNEKKKLFLFFSRQTWRVMRPLQRIFLFHFFSFHSFRNRIRRLVSQLGSQEIVPQER